MGSLENFGRCKFQRVALEVCVISVFYPLREGFDPQVTIAPTDSYPPGIITSSLAINE